MNFKSREELDKLSYDESNPYDDASLNVGKTKEISKRLKIVNEMLKHKGIASILQSYGLSPFGLSQEDNFNMYVEPLLQDKGNDMYFDNIDEVDRETLLQSISPSEDKQEPSEDTQQESVEEESVKKDDVKKVAKKDEIKKATKKDEIKIVNNGIHRLRPPVDPQATNPNIVDPNNPPQPINPQTSDVGIPMSIPKNTTGQPQMVSFDNTQVATPGQQPEEISSVDAFKSPTEAEEVGINTVDKLSNSEEKISQTQKEVNDLRIKMDNQGTPYLSFADQGTYGFFNNKKIEDTLHTISRTITKTSVKSLALKGFSKLWVGKATIATAASIGVAYASLPALLEMGVSYAVMYGVNKTSEIEESEKNRQVFIKDMKKITNGNWTDEDIETAYQTIFNDKYRKVQQDSYTKLGPRLSTPSIMNSINALEDNGKLYTLEEFTNKVKELEDSSINSGLTNEQIQTKADEQLSQEKLHKFDSPEIFVMNKLNCSYQVAKTKLEQQRDKNRKVELYLKEQELDRMQNDRIYANNHIIEPVKHPQSTIDYARERYKTITSNVQGVEIVGTNEKNLPVYKDQTTNGLYYVIDSAGIKHIKLANVKFFTPKEINEIKGEKSEN